MKIKDKVIFILGLAKFDLPIETTAFNIAKSLAKDNTVFFIDNPFTWKDCLTYRNDDMFLKRRPYFLPWSDGLIPTGIPHLHVVITPPVASIHFIPEGWLYRFMQRFNEKLIIGRIKKILRQYDIKEYIYLNSFNFNFPGVARGLSPAPALTVYQCVDPLVRDYDKRHGSVSEPLLVKNSDLVICTSRMLYEEKKILNPNTFFIPNAADLAHSGKALDNDLPIHPAIAHLKKPLVGYFGNIERRFDFDLLEQVIRTNPDMSFVFAGPISPDWPPPTWFNTFPNIHLTGRLPYEEMPSLLKGFDVAIIPFKEDAVSRTIFPLKLFEYLGAGKPVVSTCFNPDLAEYTGKAVRYCKDAIAFSDAIKAALADNGPGALRERLNIAADNTWEKRTEDIEMLFDRFLARQAP